MNTLIRQAAGRGGVTATADDPSAPEASAGLDGGAGREHRSEPLDMNRMIRAMSGRGSYTRVAPNGIVLGVG